jgi:hypothetical protein
MLAMGTSGSMSGDGKRNASRATAPILDSSGSKNTASQANFQRMREAKPDGGLVRALMVRAT